MFDPSGCLHLSLPFGVLLRGALLAVLSVPVTILFDLLSASRQQYCSLLTLLVAYWVLGL